MKYKLRVSAQFSKVVEVEATSLKEALTAAESKFYKAELSFNRQDIRNGYHAELDAEMLNEKDVIVNLAEMGSSKEAVSRAIATGGRLVVSFIHDEDYSYEFIMERVNEGSVEKEFTFTELRKDKSDVLLTIICDSDNVLNGETISDRLEHNIGEEIPIAHPIRIRAQGVDCAYGMTYWFNIVALRKRKLTDNR